MTRETKIGLLVGLAFIIVIGILLSDHLTSATEPPQAALAQVAQSVRSGVVVPGAQTAPPITAVAPQRPVAPQQPVPTREELAPKQSPVEIVQIGSATPQARPQSLVIHPQPGAQQQAPARTAEPTPPPAQPGQGGAAESNPPQVARPVNSTPVNSTLSKIASGMGEELVPADGRPQGQNPEPPRSPQVAAPAGTKSYKAEAGDSLGKIASKTLGSAGKAARDAIIALNPSLAKNPDIVVSGRTYLIPDNFAGSPANSAPSNSAPSNSAPSNSASADAGPSNSASDAPPAAPGIKPVATASPEYFYTVKPGDTLTRIAVDQLGTAAAVQAIRDLNQDSLKGSDLIRANQKLRLPAKPVASAE